MTYRRGMRLLVVFLVLFFSLAGARALAVSKAELSLKQTDWLKYYSTGIGLEERSKTITGFPLKLIFANLKGELLASVDVDISGPGGIKAQLTSEGPWLFMELVPGIYRIKAEVNGLSAKRWVRVEKGPTKVVYVHLKKAP